MHPRISQKVIAVSFLCLLLQGCDPSSTSSTPPPTPTPSPSTPTALSAVLDCIVGETINITGRYILPSPFSGTEITVEREAVITADLFKVTPTGGDELAERDSDETKIETWEGDFIGHSSDGTRAYGYNDESEEDCYKVEYTKGPFEGPSGEQCSMFVEARICEVTCTIENATWKLMCGVSADGSGGEVKAYGSWSVAP